MSENETIDNSEIPTGNLEGNFGPTCASKAIVSKVLHITGRKTWRGKPSEMTSQDKIGEDGMEQKYSCQFVEEYDVVIKSEKVKTSSVYITEIMFKQLDKLVADDQSIDMIFASGKKTGALYIVKRKKI